jgi:hypothetical protein
MLQSAEIGGLVAGGCLVGLDLYLVSDALRRRLFDTDESVQNLSGPSQFFPQFALQYSKNFITQRNSFKFYIGKQDAYQIL